jgi:hypothetical protein
MPLVFARGSGPIRPARSRRRNGSEVVQKREGWFRDIQAMASGCWGVRGEEKADQSLRHKHRLAHRVELLLEREPPSLILEGDGHWTIQHARLNPGGKTLGCHEIGETVAP